MKVTEIKPPKRVLDQFDMTVFLAGVIDMGESPDWQKEVVSYLESKKGDGSVGVFNPRRSDWDSSWKQDINEPQFFEQVSWELSHIDNCDIAVVYFTKESKAPITLMELGKLSEMKIPESIIVFCPEGYHRKGNVDILCYKKGISVHTELDSFYRGLDRALGIQEPESVSEGLQEKTTTVSSSEWSQTPPLDTCELRMSNTEDSVVTEETLGESVNIELFEAPEVAILGEENLLVVSEYDEVESDDSCIMGNIKFRDKNFFAGICKEGGTSKINLYFKKGGKTISETFTIVAMGEEYPEEKIVLAKN